MSVLNGATTCYKRLVLSTLAVLVLLTVYVPQAVLSATLVDTIDLPLGTTEIHCLDMIDDMLIVSCRANGGGMHCYSTTNHQLLWSVSLGVVTDRMFPELEFELIPSAWALSADGSKIYAGSGGDGGQLTAIDCLTGVPGPPAAMPMPWYIFPRVIDGHDVVVVVTVDDLRIVDAADINTLLYQDPLPGDVNGATYDETTDSVYIAIHDPNLLVKYSFDWSGPQFIGTGNSAPSGGWPFHGVLVPDNGIAVGCTEDGTVRIHDRTTLAMVATYPGLTHLGDVVYMDGRIILVSYYSPEPGSESNRGGVMSMDPQTGWSHVEYFDDTYPHYAAPAPVPGACCVVDAGREESNLVEDEQGGWTEKYEWVDGHLWTFSTTTLSMLDETVLDGGHTSYATGGAQNLVYMFSPDGTAIHAYSVP